MKGKSRYAGIVLTAAVHAALLILLLNPQHSDGAAGGRYAH